MAGERSRGRGQTVWIRVDQDDFRRRMGKVGVVGEVAGADPDIEMTVRDVPVMART